MRENSRALRETSKRASFRDRLKDASVPASLGVITEFAVAPFGPLHAAAAAGAVSLGTVIWQWMIARHEVGGRAVTQRYLAMLGRY